MRIGNWEIRRMRNAEGGMRKAESEDLTGIFAVSDQEPWWRAVHVLIDELEFETIAGARNNVANANLCISAVSVGEGVAMVRQRLVETRRVALQKLKELQRLQGTR